MILCDLCFCSVDAAREDGSLGRLVNDNHINPNSKMKFLNVEGKPHLCLFATQDISAGEEITYNYGNSDWPWRSKVIRVYIKSCVYTSNGFLFYHQLSLLHYYKKATMTH